MGIMLKSCCSLGGRLIGDGGGRGFSSTITTTTNTALEQFSKRKINSLSCSFTSSPSPRISGLTADDLFSKPYILEKEAKRGSDTDENEMMVKPVIRKGDVVCLSAVEYKETFRKKFETMPWLAIPFKDPNIKKLKRIFENQIIEKLKQFFKHRSYPF